jgi:hypothetical protein
MEFEVIVKLPTIQTIVTRFGLESPRFEIFILNTLQNSLEPTQPLLQWAPELFSGGKLPGAKR